MTTRTDPRISPLATAVLVTAAFTGPAAHATEFVFQSGSANGATSDTWLAESSPNADSSNSTVIEWDGADAGGQNIGLVRFDQIFGAGAGQIAPTDEITTAFLEYLVVDAGSEAQVHAVLVDWDEGVTWNTFGGDAGVQGDEYGAQLTAASGSIGWRSADVRSSIEAWAVDPAQNRGWIFRPTGANGVQLTSSEGPAADRVRLRVVVNEGPPPANVVRGPYLQLGTTTSAIIRWRTDESTSSRVTYGPAPDTLPFSSEDARIKTEHLIELTGLTPDTAYYYTVGTTEQSLAGGGPDKYFRTQPPVGAAGPTRIWVIGDSGTANANAEAVYDAYRAFNGSAYTDLWLMLGDNAYNDGTELEYQAAVFEMYPELLRQTFLWPTIGNHDAFTADSGTESGPYYDIFTLPRQGEAGGLMSGTEAYYSFDYRNIHFICLDSIETNTAPGGAMMTWLENDLADTLADWIIAFWHHPPYSKGVHDSDDEGLLIDMRTRALPILEAGGVDLVLCGHSHSYERSFLLDGHYGSSGTLDGSMIVDDGDGREDGDGVYDKLDGGPHAGAVYVVAGSSGKLTEGPLDHPAMFISLLELGSVVIDIDGGRLDATFLRENGTTPDAFSIVKEVEPMTCADLDGDLAVGFQDLLVMLASWGPCASCPADLDGSGAVDFNDLLALLAAWGPCG